MEPGGLWVAKSWKRLKRLNTFTQQLCWSPGAQQGEVLELLAWGIGCPACGQPDFVSYLNSGEALLRPQPACPWARVQRWESSCDWGGGVKLQKCGHLKCPRTVNGIVSSERGHEWEHTLWGNFLAWFNVPSIMQWSLKTKDVYDLPKAEKIRMLKISNCMGSVTPNCKFQLKDCICFWSANYKHCNHSMLCHWCASTDHIFLI